MQKNLFLSVMLFATANIYSQSYQISFAGSGASTTVGSVKVENLSRGTTLTLAGTDVLRLNNTGGINDLTIKDENIKVYPNPVQNSTELSFFAHQSGNTEIAISDISGKEIYRITTKISEGVQRFQIDGLPSGMFFIHISSINYFYSTKLISLNTSQSDIEIKYLGSSNQETDNHKLKKRASIVDMTYNIGERLLFKGISGNFSTIVTDVPNASKTITFSFLAATDLDNNNYPTVQIGTQTWMAENLKTTKYRNGNPIPNVTDSAQWATLTTGAYCDYKNTPSNSITYGKLYNFHTVADSRNLCPTGWHVPTDAEWTTLVTYLGVYTVAGGKLKETGTTHWKNPNTTATNETGFTALPGGLRHKGGFQLTTEYGYWWSSTEAGTNGIIRDMINWWAGVATNYPAKEAGISVRCLKD